MKLTRYYVVTPNGIRVGPYFRRKSAERRAAGRGLFAGLDPALARGGRVVTRADRRCQHSPARDSDPVAIARRHLSSPRALALLDEVERGRARRDDDTDSP